MRIQTKFTVGFSTLIALSMITALVYFVQIQNISAPLNNDIPDSIEKMTGTLELDELEHIIRYHDEVIENSTRNYILTRVPRWKQRYHAFQPELENLIKKMGSMTEGKEGRKGIFKDVEEAYTLFRTLQEEALTLVDDGDISTAIKLLEGDRYLTVKGLYGKRLREFFLKREVGSGAQFELPAITVKMAARHAQEVLKRSRTLIIIAVIGMIALSIVIVIVLTRSITTPIRRLTGYAETIGKGDFTQEIRFSSNDEIGVFAEAFRVMAHRLRTFYAQLEEQVRERTRELERSNQEMERFRAMMNQAGEAIYISDVETAGFIDVNDTSCRMLGYSREELLQRGPKDIAVDYPIHTPREWSAHIREIRDAGGSLVLESVHRRKDGTKIPVEISVSQRTFGGRDYLVAVVHDITKRKSDENALQRQTEKLERSNRDLDDFAYVASHDLKEPLRGIENYSQFLLEDYADRLDDDGRKKLETLPRLARRMETLIDSLLHYSRLGRDELSVQQTDLNAVLRDVVDLVGINLEEQSVVLRIPQPLPNVNCDPGQIAQVFQNLIANAMKYNDKSEKWVEVGCHSNGRLPDLDGNPPFALYVRDNGIGIQERHIGSVFRIFKRLHGREKFGGGTGAGLTISKKIIERHGGRIWAESTYGEGTTFYFTLPEQTQGMVRGNPVG